MSSCSREPPNAGTEIGCHADDSGDKVEPKSGGGQLTTAPSLPPNNKRNHGDAGEDRGPMTKRARTATATATATEPVDPTRVVRRIIATALEIKLGPERISSLTSSDPHPPPNAAAVLGHRPENFSLDTAVALSASGIEPDYDQLSEEDEEYEGEGDGERSFCDDERPVPVVSKTNQDRGVIYSPYGLTGESASKEDSASHRTALLAVYDGHGDGGEMVSQYVQDEIIRRLELHKCFYSDIATAFKDTFTQIDRDLEKDEKIQPLLCGTTACVLLIRNDTIITANLGDSRAVLARIRPRHVGKADNGAHCDNPNPSISFTQLTIDQNPDSPGEKERILESGGYVSSPPEPGLPARVWLDPDCTLVGLAMSRSVGDHSVRPIGVIAEPVVDTHRLATADYCDGDNPGIDEFLIVASDGVWEFISSEEAAIIVEKCFLEADEKREDAPLSDGTTGSEKQKMDGGASAGCKALMDAAANRWLENEGTYRDDITAIVVRMNSFFPSCAQKSDC